MKNSLLTLSRLAVVLTSALALGSCSRAEYAFLPRSASYLGTTTATRNARVTVPTPAPQAQAPAATAPEITVATTSVPAAEVATRTVAAPTPPAAAEAAAPATTTPTLAATPPKPNLVQRLALAKVAKKLNKLATKNPQFKQGDNTAHTTRIDGNLRTGIILLLIGLLVGLLNGLIGTIIAIIGVVFIVLWLLDSL